MQVKSKSICFISVETKYLREVREGNTFRNFWKKFSSSTDTFMVSRIEHWLGQYFSDDSENKQTVPN